MRLLVDVYSIHIRILLLFMFLTNLTSGAWRYFVKIFRLLLQSSKNISFAGSCKELNKNNFPEKNLFLPQKEENYWRNNPHVPDSEYYSHGD